MRPGRPRSRGATPRPAPPLAPPDHPHAQAATHPTAPAPPDGRNPMSTREQVDELLSRLPPERLGQLLDFARFLAWQEERADWQRFGRSQLARAYGEDEPDHSEADLKSRGTT